MVTQKEVITWKWLTPSASKPKTQKLRAPNKLDTTLQEDFFFAKEKKLGNLLGETDPSQGLLFLYYTQTLKTVLHFSCAITI